MYGFHDMKQVLCRRWSMGPPGNGASQLGIGAKVNDYLGSSVGVFISMVMISASQLGIRA